MTGEEAHDQNDKLDDDFFVLSDEDATNPHEPVSRLAVAALARQGGDVGRRATQLLLPEGPPPVSFG